MGIASQAAEFKRNQRASGQVALPGSGLEHRRQLELARAGAGVQPNRTPSAGLLSRLGQPIPGSPGAGGADPNQLGFNPPPVVKKRRAGANLQSFLG